jgi:hypothetical protein
MAWASKVWTTFEGHGLQNLINFFEQNNIFFTKNNYQVKHPCSVIIVLYET